MHGLETLVLSVLSWDAGLEERDLNSPGDEERVEKTNVKLLLLHEEIESGRKRD
jgi:hypothetical protein